MIISRLNGGLGNQMFQFALGRVVSYLNKTDYFLDLSLYDHQQKVDTPRSYELNIFSNLQAKEVKKSLLKQFTKPNKIKLLLNHYFKLKLQAYPKNWIRENGHQFHPEILKLRGDYLLDGYWQSQKYFKQYRKQILRQFAFPKQISKKNKNILSRINKNNAVSIHVRRGDLASNSHTRSYHGLISKNYYRQAIKYIHGKVKNPLFVVFSDDPAWCKQNLLVPAGTIFVDHNHGKNSFEDMRLMSNCKHNIIANSSFSWWGAWLNQNPDKIVIAPKPWFRKSAANNPDIIPDDWVQLSS